MSAARISTTILASMWACTRTSDCIASLRTVSVVVRVCGFHGWSSWLAWLGSRQSIKPVPGCFVDATTCLQYVLAYVRTFIGTHVPWYSTYMCVRTYVLIMLCHNFLIVHVRTYQYVPLVLTLATMPATIGRGRYTCTYCKSFQVVLEIHVLSWYTCTS